MVPPPQGCPGQPRAPVPGCSLLSPAGLEPDPATVQGMSHTGCAWEPTRGWEGDRPALLRPSSGHPAGGPTDECHQWLPGEQRAVGC